MDELESKCDDFMIDLCSKHPDPSHDILHVRRVVSLAKLICEKEKGNANVVIPAAYLHDCIYISKTDARRSQASTLSADKAVSLLKEWGVDEYLLPEIHHAIKAHSFSANIKPETLEAKIVQDADRLDGIGAVGLFRCFAFAGVAKKPFYNGLEPFAKTRELNDQENTLDHFYIKLLKITERLQTPFGKEEGQNRMKVLENYLEDLKREIGF